VLELRARERRIASRRPRRSVAVLGERGDECAELLFGDYAGGVGLAFEALGLFAGLVGLRGRGGLAGARGVEGGVLVVVGGRLDRVAGGSGVGSLALEGRSGVGAGQRGLLDRLGR
jgi:hypothetical protein